MSTALKNTLVRRALKELGIEGLDEVPNARAFAFGIINRQLCQDHQRLHRQEEDDAIEIKAYLLGTELMSMEQIKALAEMPSREVLLARLRSAPAEQYPASDAIAKKDAGF